MLVFGEGCCCPGEMSPCPVCINEALAFRLGLERCSLKIRLPWKPKVLVFWERWWREVKEGSSKDGVAEREVWLWLVPVCVAWLVLSCQERCVPLGFALPVLRIGLGPRPLPTHLGQEGPDSQQDQAVPFHACSWHPGWSKGRNVTGEAAELLDSSCGDGWSRLFGGTFLVHQWTFPCFFTASFAPICSPPSQSYCPCIAALGSM